MRLYSRIGVHAEGTNIAKDDKPIRLNRNLIHRIIRSKNNPETCIYRMIPGSVKIYTRLTSLNLQHITTWIGLVSAICETRDPRTLLSQDVSVQRKDHQTR
jgi:hypothetical protein